MTAEKEATIAANLRSKGFWLSVVSAVLALIVAFGVPLSAHQVSVLEDAAGIIIALILGISGTAIVHAHNAARLAALAASAPEAPHADHVD
jgi:uncharacterized membrane protein